MPAHLPLPRPEIRRARSLLSAFAAGLVFGASSALAAPAGFTPGSFAVTPSGGAGYSIPITLPQGVAGLQPQLVLEYNSQGERGLAGVGWSLRGFSVISRCPQTVRQDGVRMPVTLTSTDRFCLDGQRLVLDGTAYAYGAAGAVYRKERDDFSRITSLGTAGTGPASFKLETKTGLTLEFGNTTDSRVRPGPAVAGQAQPATALLWAINKLSDRQGNALTFTYTTDPANGSYVVSRIDYNGGNAYVTFAYDTTTDVPASFIAGTRATTNRRLKTISAYVRNYAGTQQLVKEYRLAYGAGDILGSFEGSRLASVTECGASGGCLQPITFTWAHWTSAQRSFSLQPMTTGTVFSESAGYNNESKRGRRLVDMNADGLADVVAFAANEVYVTYNTRQQDGTSRFGESPTLVFTGMGDSAGFDGEDKYPRHLVDMNKDGYPDLIGFGKLGVYIAMWNPSTSRFNAASGPVASTFGDNKWYGIRTAETGGSSSCYETKWHGGSYVPRHLVDVNADGYPDILGFGPDGVMVSYWTGASFTEPMLVTRNFSSSVRCNGTGEGWLDENLTPRRLADMNGDGHPDIVGFGNTNVFVAFWNPLTQQFNPMVAKYNNFTVNNGWTSENRHPRQLVDMNGDGYPDIAGFSSLGLQVALWDGNTFLTHTTWTTDFKGSSLWENEGKNPRYLVDINGDGYPDVLGLSTDGVHVAFSNSGQSIGARSVWSTEFKSGADSHGNNWGDANKQPRRIEDINGDGVPDLVGFGKSRIFALHAAGDAGMRIYRIKESLGTSGPAANLEIQYGLANGREGVYQRDPAPSVWPVLDVNTPLAVVVYTARDNGRGGVNYTRHRYGGLKAHREHGSLGFRWMATRDETTGIETRNEGHQQYPFVGMPKLTETYRSTVSSAWFGPRCSIAGRICNTGFTVSQGSLLNRTRYSLGQEMVGNAVEYAANPRLFTFVRQVVEEGWDLDGSVLPIKTTTTEYEEPRLVAGAKQWGNVTRMTVAMSDGHSTVSNNQYEPAVESSWTLGRLRQASVTDTRPARTTGAAGSSTGLPPMISLASPTLLLTRASPGSVSASITASGTGGTAPYTFAWTRLTGSRVSFGASGATNTFSVTGAAGDRYVETFRVKLTDATGRSDTAELQVEVRMPTALLLAVSPTSMSRTIVVDPCDLYAADRTIGTTSVVPSGGTSPYSISWARVSATGDQTMITHTGGWAPTFTAPGTEGGSTQVFRATVTDAGGASRTADVTLTYNARLGQGGGCGVSAPAAPAQVQ